MTKKSILPLVLLGFLFVSLIASPVSAWIGPPYSGNRGTEDTQYELFGPRVDNILMKMYSGTDSEWLALKNGEIDITDWSLTPAWLKDFLDGTEPHVAVGDAGGEFGMYDLDMNNDPWINMDGSDVVGDAGDIRNPFGDPTIILTGAWYPYLPIGSSVTRGSVMRLAVAHLIDRAAIIALCGTPPTYNVMWTHICECELFRTKGWINDDVFKYPYSPALAAQLLNGAGFVDTDASGYRNFDSNGDGVIDATDADMDLQLYSRQDLFRDTLGTWVQAGLVNLNIKVTRFSVTGGGAWTNCMLLKKHHMYTAGWILGREPTTAYFLYNSLFYWHPGDPPNYNHVSDPDFDYYSDLVAYPPDVETAKESCLECQRVMNEPYAVYNIAVANSWMQKAFKIYTEEGTGGSTYWRGLINAPGFGINTAALPLETTLNAHADGTETGGTIKYGWKENTMPSSLNPFQYSWYWDAEVLFRIYEPLTVANPYDTFGGGPGLPPAGDIPWIAKDWEIDNSGATSKFTFYLRNDVYFHDGTQMTAKDIYYTVQLGLWMAQDHPEQEWEALPPWFYGNIVDLTPEYSGDVMGVGVDMPDGPDGYTVVFNYNIKSMWAFWWCGAGLPIVPKAKWWDVFYPTLAGVDGFAPDNQMIGTGPFKVYPYHVYSPVDPEVYSAGEYVRLFAYRSVWHVDPDGTVVIDKHGYFNEMPVRIEQAGSITVEKVVHGECADTFLVDVTFTVHNWGQDTVPANTYKYQIRAWNPTANAWKVLCSAKIDFDMLHCDDYVIGPVRQTVPESCLPAPGGKVRISVVVYQMDPYAQEVEGPSVKFIPGDCAGPDPMAPPWHDDYVFWPDLLVVLVGYGATPADPRWALYNLKRADMSQNDDYIFWQDLLNVLVHYGLLDP